MAIRIREFNNMQEAQVFLRGGVRGGAKVTGGNGRVVNLDGKTLIIGAVTVTFLDPTGEGLTVKQIAAFITAAVATVKTTFPDGYITLEEIAPTTGVTVTLAGTANKIFGFSKAKDAVGVVIAAPGGAAPVLSNFGPKSTGDGYYAVIDEA